MPGPDGIPDAGPTIATLGGLKNIRDARGGSHYLECDVVNPDLVDLRATGFPIRRHGERTFLVLVGPETTRFAKTILEQKEGVA